MIFHVGNKVGNFTAGNCSVCNKAGNPPGSEDVYVKVINETSVLLIHISNVVDAQLGPEMNITQYSVHQLSDVREYYVF